MSAQGRSSTPPLSVSYAQLRAWIGAQEAFEQLHNRPAPLTDEQRRAIACLVPPPVAPPSPPSPASSTLAQSLPGPPEWAINRDFDWVGLLNRYNQAQQRYSPSNDPEYIEEPIEAVTPLWRIRCTLPREAPGQLFPGDEEPVMDGARTRKRDSKQHAARRAVEWLMANKYMPCDCSTVLFSKVPIPPVSASRPAALVRPAQSAPPSPPQAAALVSSSSSSSSSSLPQPSMAPPGPAPKTPSSKGKETQRAPLVRSAAALTTTAPSSPAVAAPAKIASPQSKSNGGKGPVRSMESWRTRPGAAAASSSSPRQRLDRKGSSTTNPDDSSSDEESSNVKRLHDFCDTVGMPTPILKLTSNTDFNSIYNGEVVISPKWNQLGNKVIDLPPEVGTVKDVYTRKAAREKMAANTLAYLRKLVSDSAEA